MNRYRSIQKNFETAFSSLDEGRNYVNRAQRRISTYQRSWNVHDYKRPEEKGRRHMDLGFVRKDSNGVAKILRYLQREIDGIYAIATQETIASALQPKFLEEMLPEFTKARDKLHRIEETFHGIGSGISHVMPQLLTKTTEEKKKSLWKSYNALSAVLDGAARSFHDVYDSISTIQNILIDTYRGYGIPRS